MLTYSSGVATAQVRILVIVPQLQALHTLVIATHKRRIGRAQRSEAVRSRPGAGKITSVRRDQYIRFDTTRGISGGSTVLDADGTYK
ncbi:hypothetical protein KC325_g133 [Hortaea werneckii]|nr:hypothetical protein KC325_g133 [Hortaea werneckii]